MASCFPCGKLRPEVKLLEDCYPPSKALPTAGPEFRPLAQDLSKLTYSCRNRSSYLPKVGEELEKRVAKEATRSTGGYAKSRSSLLISLAILKALVVECKSDLRLFARHVIRIVHSTLEVKVYGQGGIDLEVIGRSISCFIAFTTYTDGSAMSADPNIFNSYLSVLNKLVAMATFSGLDKSEKPDEELRSRTRLIALAALQSASLSDTTFASTSEFRSQVTTILPALLVNIFEGSMSNLKLEVAKVEIDASPSPFLSEFSAKRPVRDRRAPSIHAHIPGEKGPGEADVLGTAIRALHGLVNRCGPSQLSTVVDTVFSFLDRQGWRDVERCCWLSERLTSFASLQYRFIVPTRLAELLVLVPDGAVGTKQTTVLAMVSTVLNSSIALVGLGVSDLLNNITTLIIRRIRFDQQDSLLPPLVQCVASLGTHIYYADQVNDIVEELALRISDTAITDPSRQEILRVLIHCMIGIMSTARVADEAEARRPRTPETPAVTVMAEKGKAPQVDTPIGTPRREPTARRNPITVEVWQETLPLLCEATYAVRAAYAQALIMFLENEMPRDSSKKIARPGDLTGYRFCNALHAAIYTLAMSSCLGSGSPAPSIISPELTHPSPGATTGTPIKGTPTVPPESIMKSPPALGLGHVADAADTASGQSRSSSPTSGDKAEKGVSFNVTSATPIGTGGTNTPPRKNSRALRRVSLPLNRLNSSIQAPLPSFDRVATPPDFGAIIKILEEVYSAVPIASLISGVPMLLALDKDAGIELVRRPGDGRADAWVTERRRAIRETVTLLWKAIGTKWSVGEIELATKRTWESMPEPFLVPIYQPPYEQPILPLPEQPISFNPTANEGETSISTQPLLDREILLSVLASSTLVQTASGKDAAGLMKRFTLPWTVESAIKDSVERFSVAHMQPPPDAHYDIAKVLMNTDNSSYQSFSRPQSRAVDVTDLRLALDGRVDTISSAPSITSTAAKTIPDERPKSRLRPNQPTDVKDVLKEIFKDKEKKKRHHAHAHTHGQGQGQGQGNGHGHGQENGVSAAPAVRDFALGEVVQVKANGDHP